MKKINTRSKMHRNNARIKDFLKKEGFVDLYLFPHSLHSKDYNLEDCGFDSIGWKSGDKRIWLFQFKSNLGCSKKQLELYRKLNKKYYCVPCWITVWDKKKLNKKHPEQIEMWSV
jgi:hypothetical protein